MGGEGDPAPPLLVVWPGVTFLLTAPVLRAVQEKSRDSSGGPGWSPASSQASGETAVRTKSAVAMTSGRGGDGVRAAAGVLSGGAASTPGESRLRWRPSQVVVAVGPADGAAQPHPQLLADIWASGPLSCQLPGT